MHSVLFSKRYKVYKTLIIHTHTHTHIYIYIYIYIYKMVVVGPKKE